ncbi:hypothetical protein A5727_15145 [Mycobacterium sp. ACS4331]|nr:hypothetical protein A5727_15145 [Mycobacterium sp. ACS4331]
MANAAISETYVVGIPGWLPIQGLLGPIQTLPSNPDAISEALVGAQDDLFYTGLPTELLGLDHTPPVKVEPVWRKSAGDWYTTGNWWDGTLRTWTPLRGQWVDPRSYALEFPEEALAANVAAALTNWTWYLQNVNLVGLGEGAIATGAAYQAFIDAVRAGDIEAGAPHTDPREISVPGQPSNPVYQEIREGLYLQTPFGVDVPSWYMPPQGSPVYDIVKPGGVVDITLLSLILLRNPGRANGGLFARFAPIYEAVTGVNPVTPDRQDVLPIGVDPELITKILTGDVSDVDVQDLLDLLNALTNDGDGKKTIVTLKADVTWEYDLLSDAPATANPIAWANAIASSFLIANLVGLDLNDLGGGGFIDPRDGTIYYTLSAGQLPLLAPLRLPAQLLSVVTGQNINTPFSDAIEPFLRILTDIAYTDVVRNPDGTWDRTLDQFGNPALFGTRTLTKDQALYLPGDLIAALGRGVGDELTDVLTRVLGGVVQLLGAVGIQVPQQQVQQLGQLLGLPGEAITTISRGIGNGVSDFLHAIGPVLPELPDPSQSELRKRQEVVAPVVAPIIQAADKVASPIVDAAEGAVGELIGSVLEATSAGSGSQSVNAAGTTESFDEESSGLRAAAIERADFGSDPAEPDSAVTAGSLPAGGPETGQTVSKRPTVWELKRKLERERVSAAGELSAPDRIGAHREGGVDFNRVNINNETPSGGTTLMHEDRDQSNDGGTGDDSGPNKAPANDAD